MRTAIGVLDLSRNLSVNLLLAFTLFVKYHDILIALQRQHWALLFLQNNNFLLTLVEINDGVMSDVYARVKQ